MVVDVCVHPSAGEGKPQIREIVSRVVWLHRGQTFTMLFYLNLLEYDVPV